MDNLEETQDGVETGKDTTTSENMSSTTPSSGELNYESSVEEGEIVHKRATMGGAEDDFEDDDEDEGPQQGTDSSDEYNDDDIKPIEECPRRTGEEIHEFMVKNWKKFHYPEYMFGGTNDNLQPREDWDKAKIKVLVAFYSSGDTRSVSNTAHALYTWAKDEYGDDMFMDFAYFPYEKDVDFLIENNIPIMFGNASHRPLQEYDVVFNSISVFPEVLNLPRAYKNIGIPLSTEKRTESKDAPLIIMGGAAAGVAHILTGPVSDNIDDGQSLVDIVNYGPIEGQGQDMFEVIFKYLENNGLRERREELLVELAKHESRAFYIPHLYEQVNVEGYPLRIQEVKPKIEGIAEKISFNRPVDVSDHSFNRKVFHKSGGNADSMDMPISFGCTGNACSFKVVEGTRISTEKGLIKIEDLAGEEYKLATLEGITGPYKVIEQSEGLAYRVETRNRHQLECDLEHKWFILNDNLELEERTTAQLKEGDRVLIKIGNQLGNLEQDIDLMECIGFAIGDGCYIESHNRLQVFLKEGSELEYYYPKFKKYFDVNKPYNQYECQDGTIIKGCGKEGTEFIKKIAIETDNYRNVPEYLFQSNEESICAFIRGLWQADGCVCEKKRQVSLTSINKKLIDDVRLLLSMIGINTSTSVYENKYGKRRVKYGLNVNGEARNIFLDKIEVPFKTIEKNENTLYNSEGLRIPKTDIVDRIKEQLTMDQIKEYKLEAIIDKRYDSISQNMLKKANQYAQLNKMHKLIAEEYYIDVIRSITSTDEIRKMYDVVETEDHTCIYNNILTHNCEEGTVSGAYREKTMEEIKEDMLKSKANSAANSAGWFCVAGDTLVETEKGLVRIDSIVGKQTEKIRSREGLVNYEEVKATGVKPLYEVTTKQGYKIKTTDEHKFLQLHNNKLEYRKLKDIEIGEHLIIDTTNNSKLLSSRPTALPIKEDPRGLFQVGLMTYIYSMLIYNKAETEVATHWLSELTKHVTEEAEDTYHIVSGALQSGWCPVTEYTHEFWTRICEEVDYLEIEDGIVIDRTYDFYLAGLLYGDGNFYKHNFDILGSHKEHELYQKIANSRYVVSYGDRKDNCWYVRFNTEYTRRIREILPEKADYIPNSILQATTEQRMAFIKGLFDADGTNSQGRCYVSQARTGFIDDLHILMASVGLVGKISEHINTDQRTFKMVQLNSVESHKLLRDSIQLTEEHKQNSFSALEEKQDKTIVPLNKTLIKETYDNWSEDYDILRERTEQCNIYSYNKIKDRYQLPDISNMFFSEIISIEYIGEEETYDVIQTETGNYCAQGFITHNSFNLNFHTHINKLIGMISENFSQISLINMRMDELSEGSDLLTLGKINGQIRASTAIEGASERIRNGIFNKNLNEDQILEAYKNIFEQRFIMVKNGNRDGFAV